MSLQFLGAAETVTGSRSLLRHNGRRYLIDCGLFQGPKEIRAQNWETFPEANKIDAVYLTHAHIDHSGYLPKLVKEGYRGPIYCSAATASLIQIMLLDSAHLQEEDAAYANRTRHSRHEPALPLYTTKDALAALELVQIIESEKWIEVEPDLGLRLKRSGHILGSTFLQFNFSVGNGSRLLTFSGDLGNGRSRVLKPPVNISETDYLVMEATYGDRVQPHIDEVKVMSGIINKVITRGGTLVIPAFSVGRTQEVLHIISECKEQKLIQDVPVYLDSPMALDATEIYSQFPEELRIVETDHGLDSAIRPSGYHAVRGTDESMLLCMSTEPKVVISAAGMLTGGRVLHHLKARLPDEKSAVLFVGYQVEGTKGRLLRHGLTTIRIHHQPIKVEAEILSIDSLSAHADSDEIIQWMGQIKSTPRQVFLNHGELQALQALRYRIETELGWRVTIVKPGEILKLD